MLTLNHVESADARADVNSDTLSVLLCDLQVSMLHRFCGRCHCKVNKAAHLAGLLLLHELVWIEVLHLCRKADGVICKVKCLDLRHATLARKDILPDPGVVLPTPQITP